MDVGIICANVADGENVQLARSFEAIGCKAMLIEPCDLSVNAALGVNGSFLHIREAIDAIDTFLIRGVGLTTHPRAFFRMDALHALERRGKRLVNGARATELALDKCTSTVALDQRGIPVPRTVVAEHVKHATRAFDMLGGDVLVKPIYGSQGTGIFRLRDAGYAERVFLEMYQAGMVFYIQEFHPTGDAGPGLPPPGTAWDARVLVTGDRVVAAMTRQAMAPGAWKANIHAGAIPVPFTPPPMVSDLALRSAEALELEIAGVDLLFSARSNAWIVIEVNCAPGWTGLSKVVDVDVPELVARQVVRGA